jgi:hypothetical protein
MGIRVPGAQARLEEGAPSANGSVTRLSVIRPIDCQLLSKLAAREDIEINLGLDTTYTGDNPSSPGKP